jgi:hypothetical protein
MKYLFQARNVNGHVGVIVFASFNDFSTRVHSLLLFEVGFAQSIDICVEF